MGQLKLHQPQAAGRRRVDQGEPAILSFRAYARRRACRRVLNVVDRARALHRNRCCPHCRSPIVEPVELDDALRNRNDRPIPGTATLVGFYCSRCDSEWSV